MSEQKKTPFAEMISNGSASLVKRASAIETKAEMAMSKRITALKNQKVDYELKIADLLDFSPTSTTSLQPGDADWGTWAQDLETCDIEIKQIDIQLEILQARYDSLFVVSKDE